jgi:hypothetical protein
MASNSIAPQPRALDIYLDGADWKVDLYAANGTTQIASTTVGSVAVSATSGVTMPLDLRGMGGEPANGLRIFGAGDLKLILAQPASAAFPISKHPVVAGEVVEHQIEKVFSIGAGITRISIMWGGS